jgi:hypothetical protein
MFKDVLVDKIQKLIFVFKVIRKEEILSRERIYLSNSLYKNYFESL